MIPSAQKSIGSRGSLTKEKIREIRGIMAVKKAEIKDSIEDRYMVNLNSIEERGRMVYGAKIVRNHTMDNRNQKVEESVGDSNDILSQHRLLSGESIKDHS